MMNARGMLMGEQALTVKEVAARLRVDRLTVRRWLQAGKLDGYRVGGDKAGWRIPESALEQYLAGQQR